MKRGEQLDEALTKFDKSSQNIIYVSDYQSECINIKYELNEAHQKSKELSGFRMKSVENCDFFFDY